jgi:hypothetical protein
METSVLLAKVLGIIYIVLGVGILVNLKALPKMVDDFFNNTGLTFLGGITTLIFGLVIVAFHNVWLGHWGLIITVIGWLAVIKGAILIIRPQILAAVSRPFQTNAVLLGLDGGFILALGVFLTIMGFCC